MERQVGLFFAVFALKVEKNLGTRSQTCHVTTLVGRLSMAAFSKGLSHGTGDSSENDTSDISHKLFFETIPNAICTYDHFVCHQAAGNFIICLIVTSVVLARVLNQEWLFPSLIQ